MTVELTWECLYCGLDTPTPERHLRDAHSVSIETVIGNLEEAEGERIWLERMLLAQAELMGAVAVCSACGRPLKDER